MTQKWKWMEIENQRGGEQNGGGGLIGQNEK